MSACVCRVRRLIQVSRYKYKPAGLTSNLKLTNSPQRGKHFISQVLALHLRPHWILRDDDVSGVAKNHETPIYYGHLLSLRNTIETWTTHGRTGEQIRDVYYAKTETGDIDYIHVLFDNKGKI